MIWKLLYGVMPMLAGPFIWGTPRTHFASSGDQAIPDPFYLRPVVPKVGSADPGGPRRCFRGSAGGFKKQLHLQLREYFPVTDESDMWIRNPFVDGLLTNRALTPQEEDF